MADPSPPLAGVTIDRPDPHTVVRFRQELRGDDRPAGRRRAPSDPGALR